MNDSGLISELFRIYIDTPIVQYLFYILRKRDRKVISHCLKLY